MKLSTLIESVTLAVSLATPAASLAFPRSFGAIAKGLGRIFSEGLKDPGVFRLAQSGFGDDYHAWNIEKNKEDGFCQ